MATFWSNEKYYITIIKKVKIFFLLGTKYVNVTICE